MITVRQGDGRSPWWLMGLLLAASVFVAGCGRPAAPPQPVLRFAASERRAAPELVGRTLTGGSADLARLRGQIVVVNEWASWCVPCIKEAPELVAVANAHAGRGVAFLSIDFKDQDVSARRFAEEHGQSWPSIIDHSGAQLLGFARWFPAYPPNTVIIDAKGRVAARVIGATTRDVLEALITYTQDNP